MGWSAAGKRVLVTGASAGIGAALAEGFAAAGATVGLCARRADRLEAVTDRCRALAPQSRSWTVDLADLDAIEGFASRVVEDLGDPDLVVHNAGMPKRRVVTELTTAELDAVTALNYLSPVRLTLALLPRLLAVRGRVLFVGSVAARLSPPHESAYAASKAAVTAFAESMSIDLADTGVRVQVVHPGVIDTDLFHTPDDEPSLSTDIEALPTEAMVAPVLELLASDRFEAFVPDWFAEIAAGKAADLDAFLAGSAAWARDRDALA